MSRAVKTLLFVTILAGLCAWLYWFVKQRVTVKVAYQFLDAIQSKDWETVTKFLHPVEREKLRLTSEQIKSIGENLILPLWQRLGNYSELKQTENPFLPSTEEEERYFKDFRFFRVLRGNKEGAVILVTKTKEGWRINFSLFVYTLLAEASERGQLRHEQIKLILRQAGIFQIFVGQEGAFLSP